MQKQKFDLQPKISDLQKLAEDYWTEMGESWRENEKAAFDAGLSIRNGEYPKENLATIVYWKSPRVLPHIMKNNEDAVRGAL